MAYLLRTYVKNKYLMHALCAVYGIKESLALKICRALGYQKNFLTTNLSEEQTYWISQYVEEQDLLIKGDLQRLVNQKIESLSNLRTYRGIRHRLGLPLRGQRTHTNARTAKKLRRLKKQ